MLMLRNPVRVWLAVSLGSLMLLACMVTPEDGFTLLWVMFLVECIMLFLLSWLLRNGQVKDLVTSFSYCRRVGKGRLLSALSPFLSVIIFNLIQILPFVQDWARLVWMLMLSSMPCLCMLWYLFPVPRHSDEKVGASGLRGMSGVQEMERGQVRIALAFDDFYHADREYVGKAIHSVGRMIDQSIESNRKLSRIVRDLLGHSS